MVDCEFVRDVAWAGDLGDAAPLPRDVFAVERLGALCRGAERGAGCAARAAELGFFFSSFRSSDANNVAAIRAADAASNKILAIVLRDSISGLLEESRFLPLPQVFDFPL